LWANVSRPLVCLLVVAGALLAGSAVGCAEDRDEGVTPSPAKDLPALRLDDDTADILLTWLDSKGGTHTGVTIAEVPAESRDLVRVVTQDAGQGSTFYVADLREKNAEGSYAVRTMPRSEWEQLLAERRDKWRVAHAPPPPPPAPGTEPDPGSPATGLRATIYGAHWCGPCHQAAAYLKKRGVAVTELDIEKSPSAAQEMQKKLASAGLHGGSIPVIDIGGVVIQGFSPGTVDRAIVKAGRGPTTL
jgi:glutaredoxin